jgi:hypothetical protein
LVPTDIATPAVKKRTTGRQTLHQLWPTFNVLKRKKILGKIWNDKTWDKNMQNCIVMNIIHLVYVAKPDKMTQNL